MGAVDDAFAVGDFVFAIDEDCAFAAQFVHDKAVVNDLLADINRRPESLECDADHVNSAHYAGTEASRLEQKHGFSLAVWQNPSPLVEIVRDLSKMQKSTPGATVLGYTNPVDAMLISYRKVPFWST